VSGILDSKVRVIDAVITQEGKRQIANGGLRSVFASVSDKHTYYEASAASGSADATVRLYFESPTECINDSIVMESDDSGKLLGYPVQGSEFYNTDGVISGRTSVSGTLTYANSGNSTGFASVAEGIITSSIDRFKNLYSLGTRESNEAHNLQMEIQPSGYSFTMNNKFPFIEGISSATTNVDYLEPLFFDMRLSDAINFKYLPPLTEPLSTSESQVPSNPPRTKKFGDYTRYHRPNPLTLSRILRHMNIFTDQSGSVAVSGDPDSDFDISPSVSILPTPYLQLNSLGTLGLASSNVNASIVNISSDELPRERVSVFFNKTSNTNNLVMQMFELDSMSSKLTKLDVINYGTFNDTDSVAHPKKDVFFVGKIFINSIGLPSFVNLFTIIMD